MGDMIAGREDLLYQAELVSMEMVARSHCEATCIDWGIATCSGETTVWQFTASGQQAMKTMFKSESRIYMTTACHAKTHCINTVCRGESVFQAAPWTSVICGAPNDIKHPSGTWLAQD